MKIQNGILAILLALVLVAGLAQKRKSGGGSRGP